MAKIRPFAAYRPAEGMESGIAALPYDVYDREEALGEVRRNPGSFLAIDRAETHFSAETDAYAPEVYEKANSLLRQRIEAGDFVKEPKACFYLYQQTWQGRSQTGLVGCASIDDYLQNVIKRHENTRADKEEDRIRHVDACNMQTGPIFLAYRNHAGLRQLMDSSKADKPIYDFVTDDGVGHRVWVITDEGKIRQIQACFEAIDSIYIADGHHRCASAVKVGLMRREAHPDYTGREEFNYFLSVLFPDDELRILDYNRVVKDLNGLTKEAFLEEVGKSFLLEERGGQPCRPERKGTFGMYLDGEWYLLTARDSIRSEDPVEGLDVSVLQRCLLGPVLGILDPKTDKRIDFVGGIRGLGELERRVHEDMEVAFSMYPTSIEELFAVADAGKLMPPKSTWFEPKLRSGLFLHDLEIR